MVTSNSMCLHAQDAVTKLYEFNNHYFEHHGVECAPRKEEDVRCQMQETTTLLDKLQGELYMCFPHHIQYATCSGK